MTDLNVPQIAAIKALVDQLADLGLSPLHLQVDARHVGDTRPMIAMWLRYRTDFERFCAAAGLKPKERRFAHGQREWFAERDDGDRRLLVQCVSFAHHDDWVPRPVETAVGS